MADNDGTNAPNSQLTCMETHDSDTSSEDGENSPETLTVASAVPGTPEGEAPPAPVIPGQPRARPSGPLAKFREMRQRLREDAERLKQEVQQLTQERITVNVLLGLKKIKVSEPSSYNETRQLHDVISRKSQRLQVINRRIQESQREYDLIQQELS